MPSDNEVIIRNLNDKTEIWMPTTLDELNKQENYLEEIIAENPKLLKLESRRSGIRGPYAIFRQVSFETPQGRIIRPDIILFAASGHVIIVEVKRSINPELKDRRVIAQIIDYSASFSAMNEKKIATLFDPDKSDDVHWVELIQKLFPSEDNCDELAEIIMSRFLSGELNLVIACDKAPIGLDELIKGVTTQSALGFNLDVVEITPYISDNAEQAGIIFVPKTQLITEIVARTAVTITYQEGDVQPSVEVQTTPIDDIEENIQTIKKGKTKSTLTESEFWERLIENSPNNYEKIKKFTDEFKNKSNLLMIPGKNGLIFRKKLSESNNKISLFWITTDSVIHTSIQTISNQFKSLSFEEKIVENFGENIKIVLNGFSSKFEKVDESKFNQVLTDFIEKIEQCEADNLEK